MNPCDVDLFVIGGGSGGVRAARVARRLGARVMLAEQAALGGTCVNLGCIPKKLFYYASSYAKGFAESRGYGWMTSDPRFSWDTLMRNKDSEIMRLNRVYASMLDDAGVDVLYGRARIEDCHTVVVNGRAYHASYILIATGSKPYVPGLPGAECIRVSDDVLQMRDLPQRIVVVGGGYIAVEFACILHGLGAKVSQLYRGPLFLRGFDASLRHALATAMCSRGIDLRMRTQATAIERRHGDYLVTLSDGSVLRCDLVLYATGRHPNTGELGLEKAGVRCDAKGAVVVDDYARSTISNIYAVGDCTDRVNLTPAAIAAGQAAAHTMFAEPTRVEYGNIPTAVFSQPSLASVGLTEEEAGRRYPDDVAIHRSSFQQLRNALSGSRETTFMKLVVRKSSDRVLGCHIMSEYASEIIQGIAIAMNCDVTKEQFDKTLGLHPTVAEELVSMP